jgi:BirA family biotin operon repressor/biotin-[acetyl-CoA-carboxylase] ligase
VIRRGELVRLLADGRVHSGEVLARALGVTRAAVAKQVHALAEWGLEVDSVPRVGHRLERPLDLLEADSILEALAPETRAHVRALEVHDAIESTNTRLLERADLPAGRFDGCFAEFQTAGRGRRGRTWLAPYASGLCASFSWSFREPPVELAALSLAVGVATLRTLAAFGVRGAALKWPNDVLLDGRKLGGILCELRAEAGGPAFVVAGIGLNVALPDALRARIVADGGLPPASLAEAFGADGRFVASPSRNALAAPPSRNALAARLCDELLRMAQTFETRGFAPFHAEWSHADSLAGRPVRVIGHGRERDGIARGIAPDGTLRVEIDGRVEHVASGEVTLRPHA